MTAVIVTTEARTVVVTEGDGETTVATSPSPAVLIETNSIGTPLTAVASSTVQVTVGDVTAG